MQVVRELPAKRGRGLRVCGAEPVQTPRGWRIGLVVVDEDGIVMLKSAALAPYRRTTDEAMADLPCVAWGERRSVDDLGDAPIYEEELAAA